MKRTPLRRKSPLRARKPMRRTKSRMPARRSTPRRVPAEYRDPDYLAWLRMKPCRFPGCPSQTSEAHHLRHDANGCALGAKVKDDRRAISLCHAHHIEWLHRMPWVFRFVVCMELRAWQNRELAIQRAEYLASVGADTNLLPDNEREATLSP